MFLRARAARGRIEGPRAASSMAEHVAHNDLVPGSNPGRPTTEDGRRKTTLIRLPSSVFGVILGFLSEAHMLLPTPHTLLRNELVACHSVSAGWGCRGRRRVPSGCGHEAAPCTPTTGGSEGPGYPLGAPSEPPQQNQCG